MKLFINYYHCMVEKHLHYCKLLLIKTFLSVWRGGELRLSEYYTYNKSYMVCQV